MKVYLVCRNAPPNWDAVRVEVEDVVLCAVTSEERAKQHVNDMVHDDWQDANRVAVEHNRKIADLVANLAGPKLTERQIMTVLNAVDYGWKTEVPIDAFRDNYFIHELEVEGD